MTGLTLWDVWGSASNSEPQVHAPVIVTFSINARDETVTRSAPLLRLTHTINGAQPTEYRVSSRADFSGATWMPFALPLQLSGWTTLARKQTACDAPHRGQLLVLYLQVRTEIGGVLRTVNGQRTMVPEKVESNVVSDAICVTD